MTEHNEAPVDQILSCPVVTCDWQYVVPMLTITEDDINKEHLNHDYEITWDDARDRVIEAAQRQGVAEVEAVLESHNGTHTAEEYLETIQRLSQRLHDAHGRIDELEAALRGAAILQGATPEGMQVVRERHHGDTIETPHGRAHLAGKRLPDHIAKEILGPNYKKGDKRD